MNKRTLFLLLFVVVTLSVTQVISACGTTAGSSTRFVVKGAGQ